MAVRRKLDRVGVKVGLKQWQALGRGERLAICHLPIDHDRRARDAQTVHRRSGRAHLRREAAHARRGATRRLPIRRAFCRRNSRESARAAGVALDQAAWERLDRGRTLRLDQAGRRQQTQPQPGGRARRVRAALNFRPRRSPAREVIEHGASGAKLEARAQRRRHVALGAAHGAGEVHPPREIRGDRRRQRASQSMRAAAGNSRRAQLDEFAAVVKKVYRLRACRVGRSWDGRP